MTLKVQVLLIGVLVIVFILIINMVRKRQLELKYVLAWMICDIALMVFVCFPDLMSVVARFLGIRSPINMIFFLGFVFSLVIIFTLTVALSRATSRIRRLAQQVALMDNSKYGHNEKNNMGEK